VGASVDLGANSVHLLVAVIDGHRLQPLVDESVFLGLGTSIAERGALGGAARGELVAALVRYAETARRLGAVDVTFVGTEPIRRAADAAKIVAEVAAAARVPLHVLSHEEEAYLTIIGVHAGLPVTEETLVIDVGGGSSEFCIVDATLPPRAAGLQIGCARLTERLVNHDPPTGVEIEAMRVEARAALRDAPDAQPGEIVAVGGTASNLLKVLPAAALDRTLTRERIDAILRILASEPAAVASERHLVNPTRARILPAGGAIMDAILERYRADHIRVSEAGIREGTILAVEHAGPSWRDRLADLAHGWRG
jgi:exopolyphosphatase/guanosine-5'-triphosphate,3'-diphosphate pyrophosphatase